MTYHISSDVVATGTAYDDVFVGFSVGSGIAANSMSGAGGDDLMLGDSGFISTLTAAFANDSVASAFGMDATQGWSMNGNPLFGNSAIPHDSVMATTTVGKSEYFRFTAAAGAAIIIDIDYAHGSPIGLGAPDLVVELRDANGNILAIADNSLVTDGGLGSFAISPGSTSSYDPYLATTAGAAGTYYVNVRPKTGTTFDAAYGFMLNLSVGGHAIPSPVPPTGPDTLNGGGGNDHIFGQEGSDTIDGGSGNDLIDGGSDFDIIHGGTGNDIIYGGGGDDEDIHGGEGNDILYSGGEGHYYGEAGNDSIFAGLTGIVEVLDGGEGIDLLDTTTWNGTYVLDMVTGLTNYSQESFTNFEHLTTGNGFDTITGTGGDNVIRTHGGNDMINAGGGNDTLEGADGDDSLNGEAGSDTASYAGATAAVAVSLAITGGQATGGAGFDTLTGIENLTGSNFDDRLLGDDGANKLTGGAGRDTLSGGKGHDQIDGGFGNDVLEGGAGNDRLTGGDGIDMADYGSATAGVTANLSIGVAQNTIAAGSDTLAGVEDLGGSAFADALTGDIGVNRLYGRAGDDWLNGGTGRDTLDGGSENDSLLGGADDDLLIGGQGDDRLYGGTGNDDLRGNAGLDRFVFDKTPGAGNIDTLDFNVIDDTIMLDDAVFALPVGVLAAARFHIGTAAHDADDRIIYNSGTGAIWFDADGNGGGAALQFAIVPTGLALTASDFALF